MASNADAARLAEQHAKEAERLLANRFGPINLFVKAQVHATLAVYYTAVSAAAGPRGRSETP